MRPCRCSQLSITIRRRFPARKPARVTSDQSDERSFGTERDEDGLRDEQGILDRSERCEPNAIGKSSRDLSRSGDRQSRLAHSATSRQRQQARGPQQPLDFVQFVAPSDEACRLSRKFRGPSLRGGGLHGHPPYTPADVLGSGSRMRARCLGTGRGRLRSRLGRAPRLTLANSESNRPCPGMNVELRYVTRSPRRSNRSTASHRAAWSITSPRSVIAGRRRSTRKRRSWSVDGSSQETGGRLGCRSLGGLFPCDGAYERPRHRGSSPSRREVPICRWRHGAHDRTIYEAEIGTNIRVGSDGGRAVPSQSAEVTHQRTADKGART